MKNLLTMTVGLVYMVGCASQAENLPTTYEYHSVQPGKKFFYYLDEKKKTITPVIPGLIDNVPLKIEICSSDSIYICFYMVPSGLNFAVPKGGISETKSWAVNGKNFELVNVIDSVDCGANYIIEATDNDITEIFLFNYGHGLRSIYSVSSIDNIQLEEIEGKFYRFGEIFVASGKGFGGSEICN
jgi:hypothetical protein